MCTSTHNTAFREKEAVCPLIHTKNNNNNDKKKHSIPTHPRLTAMLKAISLEEGFRLNKRTDRYAELDTLLASPQIGHRLIYHLHQTECDLIFTEGWNRLRRHSGIIYIHSSLLGKLVWFIFFYLVASRHDMLKRLRVKYDSAAAISLHLMGQGFFFFHGIYSVFLVFLQLRGSDYS